MDLRFVGRERELDALHASFAGLRSGHGDAVFVLGEAGIGKSALVHEFGLSAHKLGVPVLRGSAVADPGVPAFWPWIRALSGPTAAALGLSPDLLSLSRSEFGTAAALRFGAVTRAVDALLTSSAEAAGLVIILEDLHWADEASLQLVRHLSAEVSEAPLHVVATSRDPLPESATGLAGSSVVRLGPMTQHEVGLCMGAGVHPSWARAVLLRSGGNPLYVTELSRTLDRARLHAPMEGWWELPVDLVHLIAHRLNQLSPPCRRLLDGASVAGDQFDPNVFLSSDGVGEAITAGVLVEVLGSSRQLRWSHAVVREAWYRRLPQDERIAWHDRLAALLEVRGSVQASEVARHRQGAVVDDSSRAGAADACMAAAEEATQRLDFLGAVYWYRQTLPLVLDDGARAQIHLALSRVAYQDGQVNEALEQCQIVADLADRMGITDLLVEAALVVKGIGGVPLESILALCQRARSALGDEKSARHARVLAQHGRVLADALNIDAAKPLVERAMIMAGESADREALMEALHARHEVIGGLDGVVERMALGAQLLQLASSAADRPDAALWGHLWRVDAELQLGAVSDLFAELFDLASLVQRIGWPLARWHLLRARATRAVQTGRFDEAAQLALACRKVAAQTQDTAAQIQSDLVLTELHTLTGRYGEHLPSLSPSSSAWEHAGAQWMPVSYATYGWHELQAGNADEARMMFERVRPMLATLPVNARWMATVMRTGELAAAFDDRETADLTYRMLLPYRQYFGGQSAAYLGAVSGTLSRLATTLHDHRAAVTHGTAAIEMERRVGALPFVALAELSLALALLVRGQSGDRSQALTLLERSRAAARRLDMAPTFAAATKLAAEITGLEIGVATLTPREREIAALLAAGMPNREIAHELVLSERTIEVHVHNLLPKLGLKNRTQVAAWAVRSGLGGETK